MMMTRPLSWSSVMTDPLNGSSACKGVLPVDRLDMPISHCHCESCRKVARPHSSNGRSDARAFSLDAR
jgi:hypothetical protein